MYRYQTTSRQSASVSSQPMMNSTYGTMIPFQYPYVEPYLCFPAPGQCLYFPLTVVQGYGYGTIPFNRAELYQLFVQTCNFTGDLRIQNKIVWEEVNVLSRVEPDYYYEHIINNYRGIEPPYIKNNNGHSKSPINGQIFGLFMTPGPVTGKSPFGNVCYEYKIKDILPNIFDYHLYFADFYCTKKSDNHNITIVICRIDSMVDIFCAKSLVQLDWRNNPFLEVDDRGILHVAHGTTRDTVFIHIFYTEALNLHIGYPHSVEYSGNGNMNDNRANRLNEGGVKNDKYCRKCNVYVKASTPEAVLLNS